MGGGAVECGREMGWLRRLEVSKWITLFVRFMECKIECHRNANREE